MGVDGPGARRWSRHRACGATTRLVVGALALYDDPAPRRAGGGDARGCHGKQVLDDGVDRLELLLKIAEQLGRALVRRSVAVAQRRGAAGEQETETDGDLALSARRSARIWASPPPRRASRRPGLDRTPHNEARPPNAQHLDGQLRYGGAESQRVVEGARALLEELGLRLGAVEERLDDGRQLRPILRREERAARPAGRGEPRRRLGSVDGAPTARPRPLDEEQDRARGASGSRGPGSHGRLVRALSTRSKTRTMRARLTPRGPGSRGPPWAESRRRAGPPRAPV